MAQLLHENIRQNGVKLFLSDAVASFNENERQVTVNLKSGKTVTADLGHSVHRRPSNSTLAKASGLALDGRGAVIVDDTLRTTDPSIYAVGDVIEVEDFISKERTAVPLAIRQTNREDCCRQYRRHNRPLYRNAGGTSVAKVLI